MSEIIITGSTGVIGGRVVRELLGAGHRLAGVTRSARGRDRLENLGARAVEADVFDEASLHHAFDGADAVVNVLTHVPRADRMADPSAWVTTTALRAEQNARELFDGDTVVLRFGLFIGPDSGSTLAALEAASGGASIAPGPPGAYRPMDAALAAAVGVQALRPRAPQEGPLARSQRVSSRRLREASGWEPRMRAGTPTASSATSARRRTSSRRRGCGWSVRTRRRSRTSTPG
jgi:hypothetical protein